MNAVTVEGSMAYFPKAFIRISFFWLFPMLLVTSFGQQTRDLKNARTSLILGILEDSPGVYVGETDTRVVRAVFEKVGTSWKSLPTETKTYLDLRTLPGLYPKEVTWTIVLNGENLGTITGETQREFRFYSHIGFENIINPGPVPTVGKKSTKYSQFASDSPLYRPLVAISQPNFSAKLHWKRVQPSAKKIALTRRQFRRKFPSAHNCKNLDDNVGKTWKYQEKDIRVANAYETSDGWSLIEVQLIGDRCDGPPDSPFVGQWYAITPTGKAMFLGEGMQLVDIGDYDQSGKDEALFAIDGEDQGGYQLFYYGFRRRAEFSFQYH